MNPSKNLLTNITALICTALLGITACTSDDSDNATGASDGDSTGADEGAASTGNADDSSGTASTSGGDPFVDCDRGTLETDLVAQDAQGNIVPVTWVGPGVDPATGALVDDGSTYVVSSTYLAMRPDADAQQAFGEAIAPIPDALFSNPGLVAVQLGSSMQCATARTFTVWRDETAMMEFVTSDAHAAAISRTPEISRGTSLVIHWSGAAAGEITWEDAIARLASDEGPFY